MDQVKVKRDDLLEIVKRNRGGHRKMFERAMEGYREAVIAELDRMRAEALEGRRIRRTVDLIEPTDHTRDYDRVVRMLEMSVDDEIVLDDRQFAEYAMDDWDWKEQFVFQSSQYAGVPRRRRH